MSSNVILVESSRNSLKRVNVAIFLQNSFSRQSASFCLNEDIFSPISTIVLFFPCISIFNSFNRPKLSLKKANLETHKSSLNLSANKCFFFPLEKYVFLKANKFYVFLKDITRVRIFKRDSQRISE